jgi:hypothetical protein
MIETKFINLKVNDHLITVLSGDRLLAAIKKSNTSVVFIEIYKIVYFKNFF